MVEKHVWKLRKVEAEEPGLYCQKGARRFWLPPFFVMHWGPR